jgi:hypothetical protein
MSRFRHLWRSTMTSLILLVDDEQSVRKLLARWARLVQAVTVGANRLR